MDDIGRELRCLRFRIVTESTEELVAIRTRFHLDCFATWVTYVVIVRRVDELSVSEAEAGTARLVERARELDKFILPRGLQKTRAILTLWVAQRPSPQVLSWAERARPGFAQFIVTGIADASTSRVHAAQSTPLLGAVYYPAFRFLVDRLLRHPSSAASRWPISILGSVVSVLVLVVVAGMIQARWRSFDVVGRASSRVEGITAATDVVSGSAWFCALAPEGVQCWDSGPFAKHREPVTIGGFVSPMAVALQVYSGCALDSQGVKCWELEGATTAQLVTGTDGAQDFIGTQNNYCALVRDEVLCWGGKLSPERMVGLKHPTKLVASLGGYGFCALDDEGLKCFLYYKDEKHPFYQPTFWVTGFKKVKAVWDNALSCIVVLDEGRVLSSCGDIPLPGSRRGIEKRSGFVGPAELKMMLGVSHPRDLARQSVWGYALDDTGVVAVDPGGSFQETQVLLDGKPTTVDKGRSLHGKRVQEPDGPTRLWGGRDYLYTRDDQGGTRLRCSGWRNRIRRSFVIRGIRDPRKVVEGLYQGCALDGAEVRCWEVEGP